MESRRSKRIEQEAAAKKKGGKRFWLELIKTVAIAVVLAGLLRFFVIFPVRVDGPSMQPTLHTENVLLVEKLSLYFDHIDRFDVVIVTYPDRDGLYVKRVIGLPGETVSVQNGYVYIDGEKLEDPYNPRGEMVRDMEPVTVPEDAVFVMGDNRNNSLDSTSTAVGPIPKKNLQGVAVVCIWPVGEIHFLP